MLTAVLIVLIAMSAAQGDLDGDGIPDGIEKRLGTDPHRPEPMILVLKDGRGDRDGTISSEHKLAPDITEVWFTHVGGNRYLFKIGFADVYVGKGNVFHLYVDADDDPSTGRRDKESVKGTDIMYSFVNGKPSPRIINPGVRLSPEIPVRQIIHGNAIYVCDDLKLNTVEGQTRFRIYLLSHRVNPSSDSDFTAWTYVEAPIDPSRKAPESPFPRREGFEILPAWYELLYSLWNDEGTVRLLQKEAEAIGLIKHTNDDFEGRGDPGEKALWKSPVEGNYYLVLVLYDRPDAWEVLEVRVDGERIGRVVGTPNRNARLLFYSSRPIRLHKGDVIEIGQPSEGTAPVRFRDVALCRKRPEPPRLKVENLTYFIPPEGQGEEIILTWTTNRPAECVVRYESLDRSGEKGRIEEERGAVQLHWIELPGRIRGKRYRFTIEARETYAEFHKPQTAVSRPIEVDTTRTTEKFDPKPGRVVLTVGEPSSKGRERWPVRSGVPFPDKILISPDRCRLLDPSGQPVPAQFRTLSHWRSGAVKWLLCDFLAQTEAGEEERYTLEFNVDPHPAPNPFKVKETSEELVISTGRLICALSKRGFAPFSRIGIDRDDDGMLGEDEVITDGEEGGFELTDSEGEVYSTAFSPPGEMVVEESGPVRLTVRVRGSFRSKDGRGFMGYLCRLHFYANGPWMRVVFSIENDISDPEMSLIGSATAHIPIDLKGARYDFGGEEESGVLDGKPVRLLQDHDDHYRIEPIGIEGSRSKGYVWLETSKARLLAAVRNFSQLYPKGWELKQEGLWIELLPGLSPDLYAEERKNEDLLTKLFFWFDEGRYKVRHGVRLTTEIWLDFDAPSGRDEAEAEGEWVQRPLFAAASPEWYCESGVVGPVYPRRKGWFDAYEESLDKAFKRFLERREKGREYGFINYGDWFGERRWNWGNCEYDTPWCLALNFMRTGNLEMLWRADEAAWHHGDIDVVHHGEVGRVWAHSTGHTGGYFPKEWKGMGSFNLGASGWGHTWCRGHFVLWALTGEERYYENGVIVADRIARTATNFDFNSERDGGWRLLSMMGAYQFTGNPVYLNAAKLMADVSVWKQHPERGLWGHYIGECRRYGHFPPHWGAKPFMTGILLHGLKLYDLEQPRDDVKRAIIRCSDFLWRECYIPKDNGFIYAQCSAYWDKGSTWTICLVGDGLAYGCLIDPEHRHKEKLIRAVAGNIYGSGVSSFGKSFSQATCFYPYMLHDLVELGATDVKPVK